MWEKACLALIIVLSACAPEASHGPVVLAASSMTEALEDAADAWAAEGHPRPVLSFASSATVARQAAEGAPADLVVTADAEWMDWMAAEGLLRPGTRRDLVGNRLVLVTRLRPNVRMRRFDDPAEALAGFDGRLALAEPEAVPAGRYARAALQRLGIWDGLAPAVVPAENVRATLALVERGEADMGVVYASEVLAASQIFVLAEFPADLHSPIVYPAAVLRGSDNADAGGFLDFLASAEGLAIFCDFGFTMPPGREPC